MKKNSGLAFRIFLMIGDVLAIILSITLAYYFRTHIINKPFFFTPTAIRSYLASIIALIPVWLIILATLGLYRKDILGGKSRIPELGRLFLASIIGTMAIITIDFLGESDHFPTRSIAGYSVVFCFLFLCAFRFLMRIVQHFIIRSSKNKLADILIIGNNKNTNYLADFISTHPDSGYRIVGIIANDKYIPEDLRKKSFSSLKSALSKITPDIIFQTDEHQQDYIYRESIEHHALYYFVPSASSLSTQIGELELIGSTPAILVKVTPLYGGARIVKRLFDIILSFLGIVIALIPMAITWLAIKISDPKHSAIYSEQRLSRFNQTFKIYKFRSMKPEYSGMSPEDAFAKMGKPELSKKYRANGDYLKNDPRITRIGRFIRKTSLDELPQLFNVFKGDISLVGPRALVPGELRDYGDRSLLLSVKSGLTGLAQVSGRRDIPFDERRALDIYYIQNWSLYLDFQIIFKTFTTVFAHKGAK